MAVARAGSETLTGDLYTTLLDSTRTRLGRPWDSGKELLHRVHGLIPHARYDVAVGVEDYGNVGVPEELLDVLRVDALYEQQGGARVPQIVQDLTRGSCARFSSGLKWRLTTFEALIILLVCEAKTSPLSSYPTPISRICRAR